MRLFRGTTTAIVTPFNKDGSIDRDALRRLIEFQEGMGVDAIAPCGSTGESAMLSHEEHLEVVSIAVDCAKRAKVIAGAGSNSTAEAVNLSKSAEDVGADGILSISPYYVKPTQEGIYLHYKAICESVDIPVVVYNVPGRTGSNITAETIVRMAEDIGIGAVKEASGNMGQILEIIRNRPKGLEVLSGDDAMTLPLLKNGADGVISVISNCCPGEMSELVRNGLEGRLEEADRIQGMLDPLFDLLFVESNPIPIKYIMGRLGFGSGQVRLPLTPLTMPNRERMDSLMERMGIF